MDDGETQITVDRHPSEDKALSSRDICNARGRSIGGMAQETTRMFRSRLATLVAKVPISIIARVVVDLSGSSSGEFHAGRGF